MSKPLLALCSTGKQAILDGLTGASARLFLPFYSFGYWFASGQQYTFPSGEALQYAKMSGLGVRQPNTFVKDYGICLNP